MRVFYVILLFVYGGVVCLLMIDNNKLKLNTLVSEKFYAFYFVCCIFSRVESSGPTLVLELYTEQFTD